MCFLHGGSYYLTHLSPSFDNWGSGRPRLPEADQGLNSCPHTVVRLPKIGKQSRNDCALALAPAFSPLCVHLRLYSMVSPPTQMAYRPDPVFLATDNLNFLKNCGKIHIT